MTSTQFAKRLPRMYCRNHTSQILTLTPPVRGSPPTPSTKARRHCTSWRSWATPRPPRGSLGWPTSAHTSARSAIVIRWAIPSCENGVGAMRSWSPPNRHRWRRRCRQRRYLPWRPGRQSTEVTTHTLAYRSHNCKATIETRSFDEQMLQHECRRPLPMSSDTFYHLDWARPSFGMR